jgi:hypothetical protein
MLSRLNLMDFGSHYDECMQLASLPETVPKNAQDTGVRSGYRSDRTRDAPTEKLDEEMQAHRYSN